MPRKARQRSSEVSEESPGERLQKVLAAAGVGSRRQCEQLILEGRVEVDRAVVTELGTRVSPQQQIRVDGDTLAPTRRVCYALNKPVGVVCTNHDPSGRTRVIDLIRTEARLFTIGRLDRSSEGLILVTNDGELSNRLTHPRYGVEKLYRVRVAGNPTPQLLRKLESGIHLSDGVARVASARIKKRFREVAELEIVLDEGKNREIRRLLARIGHKVLQLRRLAIGPIRLGDLPTGAYRQLSVTELRQLRAAANGNKKGSPLSRRSRSARKPVDRPEEPPRTRLPAARPSDGTVLEFDPPPEREAKKSSGKRAAGSRSSGKRAAGKPATGKRAARKRK